MDAIVREQTRYLELRLAACRARPEIHAHQIAAYENRLALIAEAAAAGAHARAADDFAIAQAEVLDRTYNEACVYAALGADGRVSAALLSYQAAAAAVDQEDLLAKLDVAARASQALRQADDRATDLVPRLLIALAQWRTEAAPALREEHLADVRACWRELRQNDPECSWQRMCEHPPYRARLPFDDPRMQRIGTWLEQAVGPLPEPDDAGPPATTSDELLARARALKQAVLEHVRGRAARRAAVAAAAPAALPSAAQAAAEHVDARTAAAPHIDAARRAKQRCAARSQPHLERQCDELIEVLERCETSTEVAYEVARLAAIHGVEAAWNEILLAYVTRAITAVTSHEAGRSDAHQHPARPDVRF